MCGSKHVWYSCATGPHGYAGCYPMTNPSCPKFPECSPEPTNPSVTVIYILGYPCYECWAKMASTSP